MKASKPIVMLLAAAAALATAPLASAQSAGQWTAKLGVNRIDPQVDSGDVSAPALPGSKADVGSDTAPTLLIGYSFTDNLAAELCLGLPYTHDVIGAGAISGTGKLAEVQVLPPTVFLQYRFFKPDATFRPYIGAGLTYVWFRKSEGSGQLTAITNPGGPPTTLDLDSRFSGSLQLGFAVALNKKWYADLGVAKSWLKTRVDYSTGQSMHIKLNPVAINLGLGYKF